MFTRMGRQSSRPIGAGGGAERTYATETVAILAAMPAQPSEAWANAIDDLVLALKAAGVWSKTDFLYWIGAHASGAALINWKAPGTLDLSTPARSPSPPRRATRATAPAAT